MGQISQTDLHAEHELDPFTKRVIHVNLNITQTCLTLTHDLFVNGLVMSSSQVVSDFAISGIYLLELIKRLI